MSHPTQQTYPKKRRRTWPYIVGGAFLIACIVGSLTVITQAPSPNDPAPAPTSTLAPTTAPTTPPATGQKAAAKPATKAPAPKPTIGGDDIVHVGEDIPAGTYRVVEEVDGDSCYWLKSKDAEGSQIIDNDLPTGGRPQVTLKSGQWFKSQGCPEWAAK